MSIRTVPRVAAALLLAALAAPAGAQPLPVAPMPRAKPELRFEVELTLTGGPAAPACGDALRSACTHDFAALRRRMGLPMPVQLVPSPAERGYVAVQLQTLREDVFRLARDGAPGCEACQSPAPKDAAFVIGPGGLRRVMPLPEPPRFLVPATPIPTGSFVVHGTSETKASACESCAAPAGKPSGTWYREHGTCVIAVTFAGDEMTVKATDAEAQATATVTAHYTLTKDGLIHGAITGADVTPLSDKTPKMELVETSLALQELVDHPFSFRAKMTSTGLSLSGLKLSGFEREKKELLGLCGLYTFARDGKVPEVKSQKAKTARCEECRPAVGVALGTAVGAACDKGVPLPAVGFKTVTVGPDGLERVGVDFDRPMTLLPPPACTPLPAVVPAPPAMVLPQPVRPVSAAVPADATKQMAVEAFGDILREKGVVGGMTLPSPRYLEHYPQYFAPDPAFPERYNHAVRQEVVAPFASQAANGTPKPKHVGTWVRDVGSKRCVLKVDADHFTLTVSEAHETEGGKTATGHLTLTVEYHLARDGVTAVGLVTGLDIRSEGDLPDCEARAMAQQAGALQKLLEEMPVALTLRPYADALVVGGVRMQAANGTMETEPAAYLGGRYRPLTDKPLPPLKAVKAPPPMMSAVPPGGALPPSGAYGGSLMPSGGGDLIAPQQLGRPQPMVPSGATLPPIPRVEDVPLVELIPTSGVSIPAAPPVRVMPQPQKPGAVVPASGVTISIPLFAPVGLQLDFVPNLNKTPDENRQLVDFSRGLFGDR